MRPTAWWLEQLQKRAERMYHETLDLSTPLTFATDEERQAAIAFFNAAFRAEESGLRGAHELSGEVGAYDPELGECLRLYGNEEGWHRELLTEFLEHIGGEVRPMGRVTSTFYKVYGYANKMETLVLINLMFETIGATTYRLALRDAKHPSVRHMLTILTRDESFHVPLNVHFLRAALARSGPATKLKLKVVYHLMFTALVASAYASRRRAKAFDRIPFKTLASAYAEHLGSLFLRESDLDFKPPRVVLALLGLKAADLVKSESANAISLEAAERSADRGDVVVAAL